MRTALIGLTAVCASSAADAQAPLQPAPQQRSPQVRWVIDNYNVCVDRQVPAERRIPACTLAYTVATEDSGRAALLYFRSDAKLVTGDFEGAIKDVDDADRLMPGTPDLLNGRCWARAVADRDLDVARAACDASLALEPSAGTHDSRGLVGLRQGRWQHAWNDYNEAVTADAGMMGALYGRGLAALALGLTAEGEADVAKAQTAAAEFAAFGLTPEAVKAPAKAN
jgi:tetratricopeptide (TPR) repeat protein